MSRAPNTVTITASMLEHSPNEMIVGYFKPNNWIVAHEGHSLYSLLKDVDRGTVTIFGKSYARRFRHLESQKEQIHEFEKVLREECGLSESEIKALDGYSQEANGMLQMIFNQGIKNFPDELLSQNGFMINISRDKLGHLTNTIEQQFTYKTCNLDVSSNQLPPASATLQYNSNGSGLVLQKLEVPSLYAPLLFAAGNIDFKQWYGVTAEQPIIFFKPENLRVPEVLLGEERQEILLDMSLAEGPFEPYKQENLYNRMRDGSFHFANVSLPHLPEHSTINNQSKEERKAVVRDYFQAFINTLPNDFRISSSDEAFGDREKEKLFKALVMQFFELNDQHLDCMFRYDPVAKQLKFEVAKPYQTSQKTLIDAQLRRTLDAKIEEITKVRKPQVNAFQTSDNPHCALEVKMYEPTENLKENTVYVHWKKSDVWFAFYVDSKGVKHDAVKIKGADDSLLATDITVTSEKVKRLHIVEKATYDYRLQKWNNDYSNLMEYEWRLNAVKMIAANGSDPDYPESIFRKFNDDFAAYELRKLSPPDTRDLLEKAFEMLIDSSKSLIQSDKEWQEFVNLVYKNMHDCKAFIEQHRPKEADASWPEGWPEAWKNPDFSEIEAFLDQASRLTPIGLTNRIALEGAWAIDLNEQDQCNALNAVAGKTLDLNIVNEEALQAVNTISRAVTEDPRLLLLFSKHTNINEAQIQEWDAAYSVLEDLGYEKLNTLNKLLVDYAQRALTENNASRQEDVIKMLSVIGQALEDIETPDLVRGPLKKIQTALVEELNYLREVDQIRQETVKKLNVPEFCNSETLVIQKKRDANLQLQKDICKAYKDAHRPLPSRQKLRKYAARVEKAEMKLSKVKPALTNYLLHVHGISERDLPSLTDAAKKGSKVFAAVRALGFIQLFEKYHGDANNRNNAALCNTKDYKAIVGTLYAILDQNNNDRLPFQGNRFAKGFAYRSGFGTGLKPKVISLPANGKVPHGYQKFSGLEEALGKRPRTKSAGAYQSSFSSYELAFELENFEKKEFEAHQSTRIFKSSFSKKTVLAATASSDAIIRSGHWVSSIEAKLSGSNSLEEVRQIEREVSQVLDIKFSGDVDKNLKQLRSVYTANSTRARHIHNFLKFSIEAQQLYINSRDECSAAVSTQSLKDTVSSFEQGLDDLYNRFKDESSDIYRDKKLKASYDAKIKSLKTAFNAANQSTAQRFQSAIQLYWDVLLKEVIDPSIKVVEQLDDVQAIVKAQQVAKETIDSIDLPKGLDASDQRPVKQEAEILLGAIKDNQLKLFLEAKVKRIAEESVSKIKNTLSRDRVDEERSQAVDAISKLFQESKLDRKQFESVTEFYVKKLNQCSDEQENFILSNGQLIETDRSFTQRFQGAQSFSELSEILAEACKGIEAIKSVAGHKSEDYLALKREIYTRYLNIVIERFKVEKVPAIVEAEEQLFEARQQNSLSIDDAEERLLQVVSEASNDLNKAIPEALLQDKEVSVRLNGTDEIDKGYLVALGEAVIQLMAPTWGEDLASVVPLWRKGSSYPRGSMEKYNAITGRFRGCVQNYDVANHLQPRLIESVFKEANQQFVEDTWYEVLSNALEAVNPNHDGLKLPRETFMTNAEHAPYDNDIIPAAQALFKMHYRAFLMDLAEGKSFLPKEEGWQSKYLEKGIEHYSPFGAQRDLSAQQGKAILEAMQTILEKPQENGGKTLWNMVASEFIKEWSEQLRCATRYCLNNSGDSKKLGEAKLRVDALVNEMQKVLMDFAADQNDVKNLPAEILADIHLNIKQEFVRAKVKSWVNKVVSGEKTEEAIASEEMGNFAHALGYSQTQSKTVIEGLKKELTRKVGEVSKKDKGISTEKGTRKPTDVVTRFLKKVEEGNIVKWAKSFNEGKITTDAINKEIKAFYSRFDAATDTVQAKKVQRRVLERVLRAAFNFKMTAVEGEEEKSQFDKWYEDRLNETKDFQTLEKEVRAFITKSGYTAMSAEMKKQLAADTMQEIDEKIFLQSIRDNKSALRDNPTLENDLYNDIKTFKGISNKRQGFVIKQAMQIVNISNSSVRGILKNSGEFDLSNVAHSLIDSTLSSRPPSPPPFGSRGRSVSSDSVGSHLSASSDSLEQGPFTSAREKLWFPPTPARHGVKHNGVIREKKKSPVESKPVSTNKRTGIFGLFGGILGKSHNQDKPHQKPQKTVTFGA